MLQGQLGGPSGAFVEPYVLGHEYGHHIQNLLGTMSRVRTQQGPRSDAVRLELQADCYAGLWARSATQTEDADGNVLITDLTDQDIQEAIAAAEAVGDDRIQEKTQGQVTQESWTHGSAASRVKWFKTGFTTGDPAGLRHLGGRHSRSYAGCTPAAPRSAGTAAAGRAGTAPRWGAGTSRRAHPRRARPGPAPTRRG